MVFDIERIFRNGSFFVTGIDTDAGKTYCTAWLASKISKAGKSVITQKFIQTGNVGFSEDIEAHRRICGTGILDVDRENLTAPVIFSYPASAQLAAKMDGRDIDLDLIDRARLELEKRFDVVLVEGAGGMMVPITDDYFAIDYAAQRHMPVVLVTNSRLGSINHTVLSLEAIRNHNLTLAAVLYNRHFDLDAAISEDTHGFVERYMARTFPGVPVIDVPHIAEAKTGGILQ